MIAVFDKSVAKSPEGLQSLNSSSASALGHGFLAQHFTAANPSSVAVNLGSHTPPASRIPFFPRDLKAFEAAEGVLSVLMMMVQKFSMNRKRLFV